MNICYVSSFNAKNIHSYSGTGFFIPKKLEEAGDTIEYIGDLSQLNPFYQKIKRKLYDLSGKNYLIERNPSVLKLWGNHIKNNLKSKNEILLAYSSQPFAKLDVPNPKVFWADAVFANMVDYYPVYSNLCKESLRDGNAMEKEALHNVDMAVFSSDWAAKAAIKYYGVSENKVRVVTYGANIEVDYSFDQIDALVKNKSQDECNLLFMGVEWDRKGGDTAVAITKKLRDQGIKATLSIVGVRPEKKIEALDYVKVYGFVSKSNNEGKALFNRIVANSHFLLLPTRADCAPIVYSEFNAHAIPVITTHEGGIPSIVKNGVNGFLFDKDDAPEIYADKIVELFTQKEKYADLCKSSFNEFKTRLNWEYSIRQFRGVLQEIEGLSVKY